MGQELKDPSKSLLKYGLSTKSILYLEYGKATSQNELRIKFFMVKKEDKNQISQRETFETLGEFIVKDTWTASEVITSVCAQ